MFYVYLISIVAATSYILYRLNKKRTRISVMTQAAILCATAFPEDWSVPYNNLWRHNDFCLSWDNWGSPDYKLNNYKISNYEGEKLKKILDRYTQNKFNMKKKKVSEELLDKQLKAAQDKLQAINFDKKEAS